MPALSTEDDGDRPPAPAAKRHRSDAAEARGGERERANDDDDGNAKPSTSTPQQLVSKCLAALSRHADVEALTRALEGLVRLLVHKESARRRDAALEYLRAECDADGGGGDDDGCGVDAGDGKGTTLDARPKERHHLLLLSLWDLQLAAKNEAVTVGLLRCCSSLVRALHELSRNKSSSSSSSSSKPCASAALSSLAAATLRGRRLRLLYACLSSGSRPRAASGRRADPTRATARAKCPRAGGGRSRARARGDRSRARARTTTSRRRLSDGSCGQSLPRGNGDAACAAANAAPPALAVATAARSTVGSRVAADLCVGCGSARRATRGPHWGGLSMTLPVVISRLWASRSRL